VLYHPAASAGDRLGSARTRTHHPIARLLLGARELFDPHRQVQRVGDRYRMHVENELGDYERADALACDWEAKRSQQTPRGQLVARRGHAGGPDTAKMALTCTNTGARYWD